MHVVRADVAGRNVVATGEGAVHRSEVRPLGLGVDVIGWTDGSHMGATVLDGGVTAFEKTKHRITSWEREHGYEPGPPSFLAEAGGLRILVIICKEILFPEDWWWNFEIDLAVHQVGFQMYDEHQAWGWRALHKALSLHIRGPVLVQVNGDEDEDVAISGVVEVSDGWPG